MIFNSERLLDVFYTGPLQIYIGLQIPTTPLRFFMVFTGICTILYNLHNYLYIDKKLIKTNYFNGFTHPVHGKYQWHRLYNLFVMYPIFLYVYYNYSKAALSNLFLLNIIVGWLFNAWNFVKLK